VDCLVYRGIRGSNGYYFTTASAEKHRKAALVACFTSWSGDRRACKMYPLPPLVQRQGQAKTLTKTSEEREGQERKEFS